MGSADDLIYSPIGGSLSDIPVPEVWMEVLAAMRAMPSWNIATIAGGALRDLDQGRPVKDVDIFVPHSEKTRARLEVVITSLGLDPLDLDVVTHDSPARSAASKIATQLTTAPHFNFHYEGWRFEITQKVESFSHRSIIDSFDIGLCMISLDGNQIYRSPEYKTDAANKTLTVVRNTGGGELRHAERLRRKYSKWKIIPL